MQSLLVSPEFGEAWQSFAGKVGTHGKEMQRIADGIYYPKVCFHPSWRHVCSSYIFSQPKR